MRRLAIVVIASASLVATACLSQSHVIPKKDLMALAQTPPEQRGRRVRVIQGFQSEDDPPQRERVGGGVYIHTGVYTSPAPKPRPRPGKAANAKADDAKWWIIVAAIVGISLAATEGARYDGWVQLHPMHPVHLWGPNGEYTWLPLAQIDPATAAWARKAIVRPSEGPWTELGRRPLSRQGLTYGMTLGSANMPSIYDTVQRGFLGHIQFGYFPEQTIGVLFDIGLGWAQNINEETIFDSRYALELEFFPVQAGKFHAGVFGQLGVAARFEDGPKDVTRQGMMTGGGALIQLDVTTRLALTARAGYIRLFDEHTTDVGIGISVY